MSRISASNGLAFAAVTRAIGFLAFWLMLAGADPADFPAVLVATAAATWASLRLLPPGAGRPSFLGLARLALRFPYQSIVAGVDVAWRALHPRMLLNPGFVSFSPKLPPGTARDSWCLLMSLLPGTLPVGEEESGALVIHCLDISQPVSAQLAAEEALFMRALGKELGDG